MSEQHPAVPTRGKAPVFLNGLDSTSTYLCIAVRNGEEQQNAVGVRRMGQDDYKLHFWPNAEFFDVDLGHNRYGRRSTSGNKSMGEYEGSRGDWDHLNDVLTQLAAKEGTSVAPTARVVEVLQQGYDSKRHFTA